MGSDPENAAVIVIVLQEAVKDILAAGSSTRAERCTNATFEIPYGGAANASYNGTGRGDGNFYVKYAGYLDFVFADATIRPIGIAFKYDGSKGGLGARGDVNMPFGKMSYIDYKYHGPGAGIRVYDSHHDTTTKGADGAPVPVKWGYYIFFQTADGTIGMIDPDVENDVQA